MTQQLKVPDALAKDLGSVPRTHTPMCSSDHFKKEVLSWRPTHVIKKKKKSIHLFKKEMWG